MNLRPHHLLCIQKFTGHGYSPAFTAHMKSVVSDLASNPELQITVTQGCDELCMICPNNIGGACASLEKVTLMDSAVLRICNLTSEENVSWMKVADKVREQIFNTEEFNNICACCQWFELCRNTEVYHG